MRIFVSHAGRDRAWAEWVGWQIEHAGWGFTVELDCWDWQAGEDFVARMDAALRACDRMVALFSEAYVEPARWTSQEWSAAVRLAKGRPGFLVPVRVDDAVVPPLLGPLIAPRLHGLPAAQARTALLEALRPPGRPVVEPPLPGAPDEETPGPRLPGVLPPVWGPVPARNEAFTGRDALLVRVRDGLCGSGRTVVHALHGAGGVGKTQLAAEYVWQFAGDYDAVWWVNAEQADRVGEQYAAFAVAWGLVGAGAPVTEAVEALRARCRRRGRWLVVLDNVRTEADVRQWRLDGPGHVVVTSRDPSWTEIATAVAVDVFAAAESVALLRSHVPTVPVPDARRMADGLGHLPLALAQAAGTLAQTGMPVAEYLQLLEEAPGEVLDDGAPGSYPSSLARSVRVTVAQASDVEPAAGQLVSLCASLAPEPIPTGWFTTVRDGMLPEPLASVAGSRLAYRRLIRLLAAFGLVKLLEGDRITVHRLTGRLLRADAGDPAGTAVTAGAVVAGVDPGDPADPVTWPAWAELLPHLRETDVAGTDDGDLAWLACRAADYLRCRGEPAVALDWIGPVHDAWRERWGRTDGRTLSAANPRAQALGALGRPQDAVVFGREAFEHYRATLGEDDAATLVAANNLGNDLAESGEHDEAVSLFEDTLARCRRIHGEDHVYTLTSAHNLSLRWAALGEFERARELAEDAMTRFRRVRGDDHPYTLASAEVLFLRMADLGEFERAAELARDVLERRRRVQGEDHPDTFRSARRLSDRLVDVDEPAQARELSEATLARCRRVRGDDHPDTLTSAIDLALRLGELEEDDRARELAVDALTRARRTLGEDHWITAKAVETVTWLARDAT